MCVDSKKGVDGVPIKLKANYILAPNRLHPGPCEFVVANEASGENVILDVYMVGEVAAGDYPYLQLFNVIIKKCLAYMNFQLIGRNYFDPTMKIEIREHNTEIMPGFLIKTWRSGSAVLVVEGYADGPTVMK